MIICYLQGEGLAGDAAAAPTLPPLPAAAAADAAAAPFPQPAHRTPQINVEKKPVISGQFLASNSQ